ncbi:methyltransferase [Embleya sp. NPDC008237]|uniref:methyltransferase n=1 Tax=Embleya sp. NPDC008237 TaxID=3363978 RepID=UPI0036EFA171
MDGTDEMRVVQLAAGGCGARALAVAARLGIADIVADGAMPAREIARRTESDPEVMARLMQTLAMWGVFTRDAHDGFALSEAFAPLRADHPRSVRNLCILTAETYDDAFGALSATVRTGRSGFERVFGVSLYEFLEKSPDTGRIFDAAMAELARPTAAALAQEYDFTGVDTLIDVGGGDGTTLAGVLADHPHLRGVCVDRPDVCARGEATLGASVGQRIADRISFRAADIFEEVPAGGDRYLLKNVLHDWPPERCVRLLTAVGRAMRRTAEAREPGLAPPRLLVLEPLLDQESDAAHVLFQMVMCGKDTGGLGEHDLRALLERAHFTVLSAWRSTAGHHVFECEPKG